MFAMVVRVMAMVQRLENSEEIVPDGVFWHGPVLFGRLIDDGGKVATTAVFHEHVEISSISIDVASYNVVMMVFLRVVTVSRWRNCTSWPRRTFLL